MDQGKKIGAMLFSFVFAGICAIVGWAMINSASRPTASLSYSDPQLLKYVAYGIIVIGIGFLAYGIYLVGKVVGRA